MVEEQVIGKGITDPRVIAAMGEVPRHLFLDDGAGPEAYSSHAIPIGYSQTMTAPYMVGYLAEKLQLSGSESILEIGTGSGYQAAVLSRLARSVYSVERIGALSTKAESTFRALGIRSIYTRVGDGALGWREMAPFDRILLTAAAGEVPYGLVEQLRRGGFLLGPVISDAGQEIIKLVRGVGTAFELERLSDCSFVPLVRDPASRSGEDLTPTGP